MILLTQATVTQAFVVVVSDLLRSIFFINFVLNELKYLKVSRVQLSSVVLLSFSEFYLFSTELLPQLSLLHF